MTTRQGVFAAARNGVSELPGREKAQKQAHQYSALGRAKGRGLWQRPGRDYWQTQHPHSLRFTISRASSETVGRSSAANSVSYNSGQSQPKLLLPLHLQPGPSSMSNSAPLIVPRFAEGLAVVTRSLASNSGAGLFRSSTTRTQFTTHSVHGLNKWIFRVPESLCIVMNYPQRDVTVLA